LFSDKKEDGYEVFQYIQQIHPDAFSILARYGVVYHPRVFRKRPGFGEPRPAKCYLNALDLVRLDERILRKSRRRSSREPLVYVEGLVMGPLTYPMLHGWVTHGLNGRKAIDWTLYATCKWNSYIGIPFSAAEHKELGALSGHINIFARDCFNTEVKKKVLQILRNRDKTKRSCNKSHR
jgi:hypothetical protein